MGQSFAVLDFKLRLQKAVWSRNPVWHLASISPPTTTTTTTPPPHHPTRNCPFSASCFMGKAHAFYPRSQGNMVILPVFREEKKEKRKEERKKEQLSTWKSTRMSAWSPRKALLVIHHHREHMQLHVHLAEAFSFFSQSRLFTMETNGQSKDGDCSMNRASRSLGVGPEFKGRKITPKAGNGRRIF